MKPLNKNNNCLPSSSNCISWEGSELCCIKVCQDDTLSDIIKKLSEELCYHKTLLNLESLDTTGLELPGDGTKTPLNILQAIINKL